MSDAVAIALDVAKRQKRAEGGATRVSKFHAGPIHSSVAGRTDHLPMTVESGSYVLPADCVSHLGENNTLAGFKVLRRMFGGGPYGGEKSPYNQSGGPYGEPIERKAGGRVRAAGILFLSPDKKVLLMRRTGKDHEGEWALPAGGIEKGETPEQAARRETQEEAGYEHEGGLSPFMHSERQGVDFTTYLAHAPDQFKPDLNHEHDDARWVEPSEAEKLPLHPGVRTAIEKLRQRIGKAGGGEASGVPIVAAGGEWVIPPSHVEQVGGGDMDRGHRVLDSFVLKIRKEHIGKLQKMKPPRKD
jgi:8-oxo-dGTP pyrophosphatase MutT (NUDIX family)